MQAVGSRWLAIVVKNILVENIVGKNNIFFGGTGV
jgi:hypothetical protein